MDVRRILFLLCAAGSLTLGAVLPAAGSTFAVDTALPRPAASGPGVEARVEVFAPSSTPTAVPPSPAPTGGVLPVTGTSGRGPVLTAIVGIGAMVVGGGLVWLVRRRRQRPIG